MKIYRCISLESTYPPEGYRLYYAFWRGDCASISVFSNRTTLKRAYWQCSTFRREFKKTFKWEEICKSNALEILIVANLSMDQIERFLSEGIEGVTYEFRRSEA